MNLFLLEVVAYTFVSISNLLYEHIIIYVFILLVITVELPLEFFHS